MIGFAISGSFESGKSPISKQNSGLTHPGYIGLDKTFLTSESSQLAPNIKKPMAASEKSRPNVIENETLQVVAYFDGCLISLNNSGKTGWPPHGAIKIPILNNKYL